MEISDGSLSFFFRNSENNIIPGLSVLNFDNGKEKDDIAYTLKKVFDDDEQLLQHKFNKIFISYVFCESVLAPGFYYDASQNNADLNLVHGDLQRGIVFTDFIAEKNLYNTYRIPQNIHQAVTDHFTSAIFIHQYSLIIKQLRQKEDLLKLIFYPNKIIITLQKAGKLQIIQTFNYITAEDVIYHMLNVCSRFNTANTDVELCGMIEQDSALFREIQKYFLTISFSQLPEGLSYSNEIKEFPPHFFSHLLAFALCV